jgi:hypothetical protein
VHDARQLEEGPGDTEEGKAGGCHVVQRGDGVQLDAAALKGDGCYGEGVRRRMQGIQQIVDLPGRSSACRGRNSYWIPVNDRNTADRNIFLSADDVENLATIMSCSPMELHANGDLCAQLTGWEGSPCDSGMDEITGRTAPRGSHPTILAGEIRLAFTWHYDGLPLPSKAWGT